MASIFELIESQLGQTEIQQLSRTVGAEPDRVQTAVSAAVPALLAALASNARKPEGAAALAGALDRDHDGGLLDQLGELFAAPAGAGAAAAAAPRAANGDGILGHVLGGRRPAVEAVLGKVAGIDGRQAGQLLALLAPVVMGALGKAKRSGGLDAGALAGLLGQEGHRAVAARPQAQGLLEQILDRDGDGQVVDDAARMGMGLLGRFLKRR